MHAHAHIQATKAFMTVLIWFTLDCSN